MLLHQEIRVAAPMCFMLLGGARPSPAGTLYYAVAHARLFAPYGARQLAYGALTPPSAAVVAANPASFLGGLVANGSTAVAAAGQWTSLRVDPPCVAALCRETLHGLQGGTEYLVFLVAVNNYGAVDPAPAVAAVTTAAATSAPALLPPTAPSNISDSGFGMAVSMDAAGGVYFSLLAAKPGVTVAAEADGIAAGSWAQMGSLLPGVDSRRRLLGAAGGAARVFTPASPQLRALLAGDSPVPPGTLVAPTCYPMNRTCLLEAGAAFAGVDGLAGSFDVLASGCTEVPEAGRAVALPPFSGLQNDTLHYLLLSTEDTAVPQPNRLQPPAVFAVHTVDLSAPRLACGFPVAANITSTSFSLAAMLTKPGASVFVVVLPAAAAATPPTADEVLRGTGAGGAAAAAAGNLTHWGSLPWEVPGVAADPRKLWAPVTGLQSGANYTAYLTVTEDGGAPLHGGAVAALRWATGCLIASLSLHQSVSLQCRGLALLSGTTWRQLSACCLPLLLLALQRHPHTQHRAPHLHPPQGPERQRGRAAGHLLCATVYRPGPGGTGVLCAIPVRMTCQQYHRAVHQLSVQSRSMPACWCCRLLCWKGSGRRRGSVLHYCAAPTSLPPPFFLPPFFLSTLCSNYTCIRGEPTVADIVAGNPLPPSVCKCDDASYCALVTAGSYAVPGQVPRGRWSLSRAARHRLAGACSSAACAAA